MAAKFRSPAFTVVAPRLTFACPNRANNHAARGLGRFSGERTRLACTFRRLAELLLLFNQMKVVGEAPTTAREARALPRAELSRPASCDFRRAVEDRKSASRLTPWCNGNTAPFGGVILGSNPSGVATCVSFLALGSGCGEPFLPSLPFCHSRAQRSQVAVHLPIMIRDVSATLDMIKEDRARAPPSLTIPAGWGEGFYAVDSGRVLPDCLRPGRRVCSKSSCAVNRELGRSCFPKTIRYV